MATEIHRTEKKFSGKVFLVILFAMSMINPVPLSIAKVDKSMKEIECLAKNIYYEARGESSLGRAAVGLVTMNRVRDTRYPSTVCEVVYQRTPKVCQFSWVCSKMRLPHAPTYREAYLLARVIYQGHMQDFTNGATHFHAKYVKPVWAKRTKYVTTIDNHIFYRL